MVDVPSDPSQRSASTVLRIAKALLVAPLVGLLAGSLVSAVPFMFGRLGGFGYAFLVMFVGALVAYPLVLVVGIPLVLFFRRFGIRSLQPYLLTGALFAAVGWVIASSPIPNSAFYLRAIGEGVFALVSGLVGAATFWAMAVRNNEP